MFSICMEWNQDSWENLLTIASQFNVTIKHRWTVSSAGLTSLQTHAQSDRRITSWCILFALRCWLQLCRLHRRRWNLVHSSSRVWSKMDEDKGLKAAFWGTPLQNGSLYVEAGRKVNIYQEPRWREHVDLGGCEREINKQPGCCQSKIFVEMVGACLGIFGHNFVTLKNFVLFL